MDMFPTMSSHELEVRFMGTGVLHAFEFWMLLDACLITIAYIVTASS